MSVVVPEVRRFSPFTTITALAFVVLLSTARADPPTQPPTAGAAASAHWSDLKPVVGQAGAFVESAELIKLGPGQPVVAPSGDG
ncbi:MAG: hypothetical protein EXS35_05215 [Pedosphaera sp.]|nr:hypothetical protein [Pedosphaera sp.]